MGTGPELVVVFCVVFCYYNIEREHICCLLSTEIHAFINWLKSAAFHFLLMWKQTNRWSYAILIINFGKSIVPEVIVMWPCIIYWRETVLDYCFCLNLYRLICHQVYWMWWLKPKNELFDSKWKNLGIKTNKFRKFNLKNAHVYAGNLY